MDSSEFWEWFTCESNSQFAVQGSKIVVDRIYDHLCMINPNLAVEVSEPDALGSRELIISANGNSALFGLAREIVNAAPPSKHWRFVALKPPRGFDFMFRQGTETICPSTWQFNPLRDATGRLGIRIFVPGLNTAIRPETLQTVIEIGVGEEEFATVQHVDYTYTKSEDESSDWLAIKELRDFLRWTRRGADPLAD